MGGWELIYDLMLTLGAALVLGILFERLKQNAIIGYLVAGTLLGPSVTGFVTGSESIMLIAELGVVLLLFTLGLEFSFQRLKGLGKVAFIGGTFSILLIMLVISAIGLMANLPWQSAVTIGAIASLSSTALIMRILKDRNDLDSNHGKAAIGVVLLQDLAVVPLVILVTFLGAPTGKQISLGGVLLGSVALVGVIWLVTRFALKHLLSANVVAKNREIPVLLGVSFCIAASWGAHHVGLSPALGAFIAGMLLAETTYADQMRVDIYPLRTLFLTIFFASIGMLLDVKFVVANPGLVLGSVVLVIFVKVLFTFAACKLFVPSTVSTLTASIILAQVGEFSFVLARIGATNGALTPALLQLIVSVSAISLFLTPYMIPLAPKLSRRLAISLFPTKKLAEEERQSVQDLTGHIILVGYGTAGQRAGRVLQDQGETVLVMELDPLVAEFASRQGLICKIGDATQTANLTRSKIQDAKALIVALPDVRLARLVLSNSKLVAPHVPVVCRARYHHLAAELDMVGADVVVDEEFSMGEQLGQAVLKLLTEPRKRIEQFPGHSEK
jgi:CPA2 family monovalent cation:H+ antiporter-2